MNLLVDLSYTQNEGNVVTGLHLYGKELVRRLSEETEITLTVSLLYGAQIDEDILNNRRIKFAYLRSPKESAKYFRELSELADQFDAVFFPYQVFLGKLRIKKARLYMTIHDLTPLREVCIDRTNKYEYLYKNGLKQEIKYFVKCLLRFSHLWYLRRYRILKFNAERAYRIFTVSEFSKRDIIQTFSISENKIKVAYSPSVKERVKEESKLSYQDFYLLISTERYQKNAHMALYALDELWSEGTETRKVILTGNLPKKIRKKLKHPENTVSLGYVSDGDLEYLYQHAYCFIFPSLSEGFGLPPAEAMKYGTRVISSDAMSLKELYENTVLFDPYSVKDIKRAILSADTLRPEPMIEISREIRSKQESAVKTILDEFLHNER